MNPQVNIEDYFAIDASDRPTTWWWLSFVHEEREEGDRFVGACIVQATSVVTAAKAAWDNDCNPGGQISALPFPPLVDLTEWGNRLLTRDQVTEFDQWMNEKYPHPPTGLPDEPPFT